MCKCTPDLRTPFCGKPGCEWPEQKNRTEETMNEHIGKLVVVAHWMDFDLQDATTLGILEKIQDGHFYIVGSKRGYRHCRIVGKKISANKQDCPADL